MRQSRRLAAAYDITPDWAALDELEDPAAMDTATAGLLEAETFTTEATFDAMGRPVTQTTPDASVLHLGYGDAGHLETVAANVRGGVSQTSFVTDLRYNARGQRTLVVYGNGTQTSYAYDPQTFRLTQLQTERTADSHLHQDLRYTFDPAGNITEIRDLAQPIVFTNNAAVSADQRFEYDALYRLVHAEGREHGSQGQPTADDFISRASPDDPTGLRPYTEQYLYDAVGNILQMQHAATGGSWTRHYSYDPATSGNRLLANSAPGDAPGVYSHTYAHDAHGSMTAMPHLAAIGWDWADRMQSADLGGGGTVHFTYDAAGQRVRKLRVNQAGTSTWERIYLGGFELYREHVGTELRLERQTLHVGDDAGRVCLVETKTIDNALPIATPANISRYQYANHLGTVGLELDETGQLISYEEFHPYGTTAYRAANSAVDVSPSRYRYTGKERDEETGLGYHGARYYASWLARWTAADPIGLGDGPNRFAYVRGRPTALMDSTGTMGDPPPDILVGKVTMREGESIRSATARGIQEGFIGIDDLERAEVERDLPERIPVTKDKSSQTTTPVSGDELTVGLPLQKIREIENKYDAQLRERADLWVPWLAGQGTESLDEWGVHTLEIMAGVLVVVDLVATASGLKEPAKNLLQAGKALLESRAAKKAAARGAAEGAGERVVGREVAQAAAAKGGAPPIAVQKQAGHVPGTPQHAIRVGSGKPTSTFFDAKQAESATLEAWQKGTPLGTDGRMRLYDFGRPVAVGPGGGGYQTQVRVSMDAKGRIHGTPWGRVYEGPLPQ